MINIGLKLDGIISWPWPKILWPVWSLVGGCFIVGFVVIMFIINFLCYYITNSDSVEEFYLLVWLAYSLFGLIGSLCWMFIATFSGEGEYRYIGLLAYFAIFVVTTMLFHNKLVESWASLFTITRTFDMLRETDPRYIPRRVQIKQPPHRRVVVFKSPPSFVTRISNSYFKPTTAENKADAGNSEVPENYNTYGNKLNDQLLDGINLYEPECEILDDGKNESNACEIQVVDDTGEDDGNKENQMIDDSQSALLSDKISCSETYCTICSENECNGVFMGCGHGGLCYACAEKIMDSKGTCHICRGQITCSLKIVPERGRVFRVIEAIHIIS